MLRQRRDAASIAVKVLRAHRVAAGWSNIMKAGLSVGSAVVLLGIVGASIAGCSSSSKVPTNRSSAISSAQSAISSALGNLTSALAPSSATASTSVAPSSSTALDLSGSWHGQYSGSSQGTFALTWQQSGTSLVGTIQISDPAQTLPLTGTLSGATITFGTVGSLAVTYTGTASGSSMSGTYAVGGTNAGSWSATKS
jgi:hypothetical protein